MKITIKYKILTGIYYSGVFKSITSEIYDEVVTTVDESELEFKNGNHYYKKYKVEYIIRNS